ncbi:MAG: M3 family metallopeptidase [Planctomycetota bacterium]
MQASSSPNPLLDTRRLPRYADVTADHVEPGIRELLARLAEKLSELEQSATSTWDGLVEPFDRIRNDLYFARGMIEHLLAVKNSAELRAAFELVQPELVRFELQLRQSQPLYARLQELVQSDSWDLLEPPRRRIVESLIRRARESGAELSAGDREQLNAIWLELAQTRTRFSNQLLDATKAYSLLISDPSAVADLPASSLELAAQSARQHGYPEADARRGPWRFTLDAPSYRPFLEHCTRSDLREQIYRAMVTRAGSGTSDNTPLITRTLALRQQAAQLLGFADYASLSLSSKMAGRLADAEALLEELRRAALPAAQVDLARVEAFAHEQGFPASEHLAQWDVPYWAERLREQLHDLRDEDLRPYFPLDRVLQGLFDLCERLFGIRVRAADGASGIWHDDVRYYEILDESGNEIAGFYFDPFSRPQEKRGGAWMSGCVDRSRLHAPPGRDVRLPVALVICNQAPPLNGQPSLMSFDEVKTLFHEFGHALHHMLTRVDDSLAAGTNNVEWDAVEIPSLFMENWCYHPATLRQISGHVESGDPLPDSMIERVRDARHYLVGTLLLRQLHFAFTDLALHSRFDPFGADTPFDEQRRVAQMTTVIPPIAEDRFLCSFQHIFAGGYAAGYYSYQWAQALSADVFAAFQEAGLDDDEALARTGRRFRETFLELGGGTHPLTVFRSFRGRDPSPKALLQQAGLA